jgi:hypothetical protein
MSPRHNDESHSLNQPPGSVQLGSHDGCHTHDGRAPAAPLTIPDMRFSDYNPVTVAPRGEVPHVLRLCWLSVDWVV